MSVWFSQIGRKLEPPCHKLRLTQSNWKQQHLGYKLQTLMCPLLEADLRRDLRRCPLKRRRFSFPLESIFTSMSISYPHSFGVELTFMLLCKFSVLRNGTSNVASLDFFSDTPIPSSFYELRNNSVRSDYMLADELCSSSLQIE
ncbi:hypothetical protein ACFX2B_009194 [Malus domestica]